MPKVLVVNETTTAQFVSGRLLHPGQSMEVDAHLVPAHLKPARVETASPASTGEAGSFSPEVFLEQSVKDLLPQLPGLSDIQAAAVKNYEQQTDAPRTSLIDALDAELLKRG